MESRGRTLDVRLVVAMVAGTATVLAGHPSRAYVVPDYSVSAGKTRDLDQRRTGLVSNNSKPGNLYCGPASAADVIYFLGERGRFALIDDIPAGWTNEVPFSPSYAFDTAEGQTNRIWVLADWMSSGNDNYSTDGTYSSDLAAGIADYYYAYKGTAYDWMAYVSLDVYGKDTKSELLYDVLLAGSTVKHGAIGVVLNGRYTGWASGSLSRSGGHFRAFTGVRSVSDVPALYISNPLSDEGNYDTQSAGYTAYVDSDVRKNTGENAWYMGAKTLSTTTNDKQAIIEELMMFRPSGALSYTKNINVSGLLANLAFSSLISTVNGEYWYGSPGVESIDSITSSAYGTLTDMQWSATGGSMVFGHASGGEVYEYFPGVGVYTIATLASPVKSIASRTNSVDLFALAGSTLYAIRAPVDGLTARPTSSVSVAYLRATFQSLVLEPLNQYIGVLDSLGYLSFYDGNLAFVRRLAIPSVPGTGALTVRSSPETGYIYFKRAGSGTIVKARYATGGFTSVSSVTLAGASSPQGFDVDPKGYFHTVENGAIKSYDAAGQALSSRLTGLAAFENLVVPRNFSNSRNLSSDAPDPLDLIE